MKIAVTGANSSVGKILLERLTKDAETNVVAGVRNKKAFSDLPQNKAIKPSVIAYDDIQKIKVSVSNLYLYI